MNILALDTSTMVLGVAILQKEKVLASQMTNCRRNHAEQLMNVIIDLLAACQLEPHDLDQLAVTRGPGSYTGIRIGVTAAKTLAWALDIPLYSESTLRLMAENGRRFPGLIVPLIDARRSRVYAAGYQQQGEQMQEVLPQQVWPIESLLTRVQEQQQPVLFLGQDEFLYRDQIAQALGDQWAFGRGNENLPQPSHLGRLTWEKWQQQIAPEPIDFAPEYLQLTEAESKWNERHKKA
jgi:tRNA threonylcarbamoyladenosine biosynthesis protein TsaB